MANVGTAPAGKTLIGKGNTTSPTFADIGTDSGLTSHGILIAQGAGSFVASSVGTAGQIFQSSGPGVDPTYSSATYPSTTSINQILYSSANNVVSEITSENFGVLISGATGIPSWLPNGVTGQVLSANTGGSPSWVTAATGTVTSVSGTADRITSTGGTDPILDIASTYAGQTSITTLGTITSGVWNASLIPMAFGGTNANLTPSNGGIFYSTATAGSILAGTATASQVLMSGSSAAPTWSTSTYPSTASGTGTILRADGTNWIPSTATYPDTAGTSGNILTSDGTNWVSSAPSSGGITQIQTQVITATGAGTYTPTSGMVYVTVECIAGGGGGAGSAATTSGQLSCGAGGAGGTYMKCTFSASDIGISQPYSIGVGGLAGTAGVNNGGAGGATSFGTTAFLNLMQCGGGLGGIAMAATAASFSPGGNSGTIGGVPTGRGYGNVGQQGGYSYVSFGTGQWNGAGGAAGNGGGSNNNVRTTTGSGSPGLRGCGGSGGFSFVSSAAQAGGAGGAGYIIITEYIS